MADGELAAWRPSVVIGSTYLLQGSVYFLGAMMIGTLAERGTPIEDYVGVLASGAIPWVLKFVFGLLLDLGPSWSLRVRSLVSTALLASAALSTWALARAWAPGVPDSLFALALIWLALNFSMAMQDVLVDALALDLLADHRTLAATGMGLGHALGSGLIGPLVVYPVVAEHGYAAALELGVFAIAVVAVTPLLLWAPGRPRKARERPAAKRERSPNDWLWLLAVPVCSMLAMLAPNVSGALTYDLFLNELGWQLADFFTLLMPLGAIAGVVGALAWGPLIQRVGPIWPSAGAALVLGVISLIFVGFSNHWTELWLLRSVVLGEGFMQSALQVGLYALALVAAARSPLPITGFVLLMAALNLPRVLGPLIAPRLLVHGWVAVFAGCGAVLILAALGLSLLARRANNSSDPQQPAVD